LRLFVLHAGDKQNKDHGGNPKDSDAADRAKKAGNALLPLIGRTRLTVDLLWRRLNDSGRHSRASVTVRLRRASWADKTDV
jgi:hypothetical protein